MKFLNNFVNCLVDFQALSFWILKMSSFSEIKKNDQIIETFIFEC